ncbi:MAG: AarF/UbiB family protein [Acidimicrobiales bacterium]
MLRPLLLPLRALAPRLDIRRSPRRSCASAKGSTTGWEAANQQRFARAFAGHPHLHVPAVYEDLSSDRVLSTELVAGHRTSEAATWKPRRPRRRVPLPVRGLLPSTTTASSTATCTQATCGSTARAASRCSTSA